MTYIDHHAERAHAAEAAQWMHEEMQRNKGTLTQEAAWNGVLERFGKTFACKDETGSWLAKSVLIAFRQVAPTSVWDWAGKRWHERAAA